jgi:hypothetical protein
MALRRPDPPTLNKKSKWNKQNCCEEKCFVHWILRQNKSEIFTNSFWRNPTNKNIAISIPGVTEGRTPRALQEKARHMYPKIMKMEKPTEEFHSCAKCEKSIEANLKQSLGENLSEPDDLWNEINDFNNWLDEQQPSTSTSNTEQNCEIDDIQNVESVIQHSI